MRTKKIFKSKDKKGETEEQKTEGTNGNKTLDLNSKIRTILNINDKITRLLECNL